MDIESAVVVTEGKQWEKDLPEMDDLELLIAPGENSAYQRELDKRVRALPPNLRADGAVEPGAYYRCVGLAIGKAVLFGWRNFKVGGKPVDFDPKVAEPYLIDQKYKPFRDAVVTAARRVQQGVKKAEEDLVGNSSASSPGKGTGEATQRA